MAGSILPGSLAIIRHSVKKILMSKRTIVVALIVIFLVAVMGYGGSQDMSRLKDGTNLMDYLILMFFMPVMSMIYGSALIRDEIEDKSITQVITSPLPRPVAYISYYVALAISTSIMMIFMTVIGFLAFFVQKGIDGGAMSILWSTLGLSIIGSFVYSSLFLVLGVIMKRPVYLGLFYAFIWEGFIGSMPGFIAKLSIRFYIRSIGTHWIKYGDIGHFSGWGVSDSSAILLGIMVVLLAIGAFLFSRKEFP